MLIEFKFSNYRSFRDETVLSMEATGLGTFKNCLIQEKSTKLLPGVAIYGKNGGGKSNVIRAFWLAVQFIKNAQRTQHEKAEIPVMPFGLNDYSKNSRHLRFHLCAERNQILVRVFSYKGKDNQRISLSCAKRTKGFDFFENRTRFQFYRR